MSLEWQEPEDTPHLSAHVRFRAEPSSRFRDLVKTKQPPPRHCKRTPPD